MVKKVLTIMILLGSLLLFQGCGSNKVILYPIDKQDIVVMPTGTSYTPDRDGFFMSKFYVKNVMDAKIK